MKEVRQVQRHVRFHHSLLIHDYLGEFVKKIKLPKKEMAGALIKRNLEDGFRKVECLGKMVPGEITVSVLQWNVLCDSLANSFDKVP